MQTNVPPSFSKQIGYQKRFLSKKNLEKVSFHLPSLWIVDSKLVFVITYFAEMTLEIFVPREKRITLLKVH